MQIHHFIKFLIAILAIFFTTNSFASNRQHNEISDLAETVEEAVEIIIRDLEDQGFEIVLVLDHAANAARVGLELRPTQIVFARPPHRLEKRLLKRNVVMGLDLPLKFLVFEDEGGDIQLRYNPIGYLVDRHDLTIKDRTLSITDSLIEQFGTLSTGILSVESLFDRDTTVQNLRDIIGGIPAFGIPLVLDYGKKTSCTLIVFGNPMAGTPLMQATQEVALDLPQKFLVCANGHYQAEIFYNDPLFIGNRHNVQGEDQRLQAVAGALRNFATMAAGQ